MYNAKVSFKWSVIIFLNSNFQVAFRVFLFKGDICLVAQNFILNSNVNNLRVQTVLHHRKQYDIWYPNTEHLPTSLLITVISGWLPAGNALIFQ